MIKQYSFLDEKTAKTLIDKLELKGGTTSKEIHGIVELGFQDKYEFNQETQESILVKKGQTYDVDVFWVDKPAYGWGKYEVFPKTPNHNFA